MSPTSLTKAQQAEENRAYVRRLLWQRQPAFAATLAAAEQYLSYVACPCRQQDRDHRASVPGTAS
jgi:hypothetical protein